MFRVRTRYGVRAKEEAATQGRVKVWDGSGIRGRVWARDRILLVVMIAVSVIVLRFCMGSTVIAAGQKTPALSAQDPRQDLLQDTPQDPLRAGLTPGSIIGPSSESGECGGIDFGEVRPSLSPYVVPMAFQITCTSRENPIQVTIKGEDLKPAGGTADPENLPGEPNTIPCARISWKMSGEPSWSQLTENPASLAVVPAGERRNICLDFRYDVLWEDPVGEYSAPVTVSFLPRAEAVLSRAVPNPFSPNGDGIKDETVIACDLTWEHEEPETIECILDVPGDGSSEPVKRFEISGVYSPTTAWVTWDGTDESGRAVPDACYRYSFHKAGQSQEFSSGIVVVDTNPPSLTVFSPKDGEEVTSTIAVSGQTESEECLVSVSIQDRLTSQARPSADGSFSLGVAAPPGISRLSVVSEDLAGNRSSRHIDVVNNTAVTILGPSYRETRSSVAELQGLAPVSAVVALVVNGYEAIQVKSTEQGEWAAGGVRLAPGDNTVAASAINQRGEIVVSKEPVTVRYVPSAGSAKITGAVTDASTGESLEDAEVSLVSQEGGVFSTVRTDEDGAYELDEILPGTYTLQASCLNYCTFETDLIELASGEEITLDFALVSNKALRLEKSVNVDACSIGDIVKYTLTVENLTDIEVNNVKVYDLLPQGIAVIPGTSSVRGKETQSEVLWSGQAQQWESLAPGQARAPGRAVWTIGTLGPRKTATVSFMAAVGFCDRAGGATNRAYATGETKSGSVKTPTSEATLFVSEGIFSNDGLIFGKVFVDADNDGKMGIDEHGLSGARITTEDGSEISTDHSGMYTIKGIRPGFHMLVLSSDSLPQGFRCEERAVLAYVGPYSIVRLDFPVVLCEPTPGDLLGNVSDDCNADDDCSVTGAVLEAYNQEPIVMVAVGEATLSSGTSSGTFREDHEVEQGNDHADLAISGNLAFFMSGRIDERHTLTCGLDLAGRGRGNLGCSDPGCADPRCGNSGRRNRGCPDPEAFSPDYGDASKVVRALPYAGPLYVSLKGDAWEASYSTFRTDFIKSELAPYRGVLPGAIVRYEKGNFTATFFDSIPCTTTGRIQGGAFEAQMSPKLTLGGGVVRHRESHGAVYVYNIHGQYLSDEGLSAYCELSGSSGGHAGGGLCVPTGSGALSLRCMKELGPVSLEARYKAVGPHFFNSREPDAAELSPAKLNSWEPDAAECNRVALHPGEINPEQLKPVEDDAAESDPSAQMRRDTCDFSLKATVSPVTSLLPRLSLSGEARVVRDNISLAAQGLANRKTACELGAMYVLGDSSIIAVDARHATTVAEGKPDAAIRSPLMMKDKSFGIKVKGRMPQGVSGSLGVRWGERTDYRGNLLQVGYNKLEAEAKRTITRELSVSLKGEASFESEGAIPIVPAGRLSTKLGIGVDWIVSPYLRSRARVSSSSSDGTVLALRMAYRPSSRLEAVLTCETETKTGESQVAFKVDADPIPGLGLTVSYDREGSWNRRTSLGYELGFTWRPIFPDRFMAFGGIKGKEAATGAHREFCRVLTGQAGMAFAIDPLTDVSARCVWKQVSEGGTGVGADAHVETGLATFRITHRFDMSKHQSGSEHQSANNDMIGNKRKDGSKNEIDVTCESSLYFVDVEKQRKTESAIEVGISISKNARLALGYKWTRFRQGTISEVDHAGSRVYARLGLGWATGI